NSLKTAPLQNPTSLKTGYYKLRSGTTGREQPASGKLALLALHRLFRGDRAAPRALSRARIGVRALPANGKIAAVANPAVRLNFDQTADVHLNLLAEIAFDAAFLLDHLADVIDLVLRQVANLFRRIDVRLRRDFSRALLPDAVDGRQANPQAL